MKSPGYGKITGRFDSDCPATREILSRVGDKWSVFIVVLLGDGPRRFSELKRTVGGISQRVLTVTLRSLERDGLVKRTVRPTNPPQVEYALTPLGRSLMKPVSALARWAQGHKTQIGRARETYAKRQEAGAV